MLHGRKLIFVDKQYSKLYKTYFGKDVIDKTFNDMINECGYCHKIIEREFNKPLAMTKKNHKNFKNLLNVGFFKKHVKKVMSMQ